MVLGVRLLHRGACGDVVRGQYDPDNLDAPLDVAGMAALGERRCAERRAADEAARALKYQIADELAELRLQHERLERENRELRAKLARIESSRVGGGGATIQPIN